MTIREALRAYASIEADLILAHTLRVDKEFLYLHPDKMLPKPVVIKFQGMCRKRQGGYPTAYLLGYKYFCNLRFKVDESVLVPRPESEWLVAQAVNHIQPAKKRGKKTWRVLDMGTGSGCLIISLAKQLEGSMLHLVAADISSAALATAKKNAALHNVKIDFKKSDLFEKITGEYDVIFANLPYVSRKDYKKLRPTLKYEPALAITTGDNTWEIYKRFLKQLPQHINKDSVILLEIDPSQKPLLENEIARRLPGVKIAFTQDIHKLWRSVRLTF